MWKTLLNAKVAVAAVLNSISVHELSVPFDSRGLPEIINDFMLKCYIVDG